MIVYHGSYKEIINPDIYHSRKQVDFSQGFYVTPIKDQAQKWCRRFMKKGQQGIVSIYSFDESVLQQLNVLQFDSYDENWLDFVLNCRKGNDQSKYDIVIGGIANDKVFNTIELYFDGLIDKHEAIQRLKYEKPNLQICFRNQKVIDKYIHYEGSEKL